MGRRYRCDCGREHTRTAGRRCPARNRQVQPHAAALAPPVRAAAPTQLHAAARPFQQHHLHSGAAQTRSCSPDSPQYAAMRPRAGGPVQLMQTPSRFDSDTASVTSSMASAVRRRKACPLPHCGKIPDEPLPVHLPKCVMENPLVKQMLRLEGCGQVQKPHPRARAIDHPSMVLEGMLVVGIDWDHEIVQMMNKVEQFVRASPDADQKVVACLKKRILSCAFKTAPKRWGYFGGWEGAQKAVIMDAPGPRGVPNPKKPSRDNYLQGGDGYWMAWDIPNDTAAAPTCRVTARFNLSEFQVEFMSDGGWANSAYGVDMVLTKFIQATEQVNEEIHRARREGIWLHRPVTTEARYPGSGYNYVLSIDYVYDLRSDRRAALQMFQKNQSTRTIRQFRIIRRSTRTQLPDAQIFDQLTEMMAPPPPPSSPVAASPAAAAAVPARQPLCQHNWGTLPQYDQKTCMINAGFRECERTIDRAEVCIAAILGRCSGCRKEHLHTASLAQPRDKFMAQAATPWECDMLSHMMTRGGQQYRASKVWWLLHPEQQLAWEATLAAEIRKGQAPGHGFVFHATSSVDAIIGHIREGIDVTRRSGQAYGTGEYAAMCCRESHCYAGSTVRGFIILYGVAEGSAVRFASDLPRVTGDAATYIIVNNPPSRTALHMVPVAVIRIANVQDQSAAAVAANDRLEKEFAAALDLQEGVPDFTFTRKNMPSNLLVPLKEFRLNRHKGPCMHFYAYLPQDFHLMSRVVNNLRDVMLTFLLHTCRLPIHPDSISIVTGDDSDGCMRILIKTGTPFDAKLLDVFRDESAAFFGHSIYFAAISELRHGSRAPCPRDERCTHSGRPAECGGCPYSHSAPVQSYTASMNPREHPLSSHIMQYHGMRGWYAVTYPPEVRAQQRKSTRIIKSQIVHACQFLTHHFWVAFPNERARDNFIAFPFKPFDGIMLRFFIDGTKAIAASPPHLVVMVESITPRDVLPVNHHPPDFDINTMGKGWLYNSHRGYFVPLHTEDRRTFLVVAVHGRVQSLCVPDGMECPRCHNITGVLGKCRDCWPAEVNCVFWLDVAPTLIAATLPIPSASPSSPTGWAAATLKDTGVRSFYRAARPRCTSEGKKVCPRCDRAEWPSAKRCSHCAYEYDTA